MKNKKLPEKIFAVFEQDVVPRGNRSEDYGNVEFEKESKSLEKLWDKDIMLSGCVSHVREWFGLFHEPVMVGVYVLVETKTIAPLTDKDLERPIGERIEDKFL